MAKVKFAVFSGNSWVSKCIKFVTRSRNYSHVGYIAKCGVLIECWPTERNRFQHWMVSSFRNHSVGTPYEIWELTVTDDELSVIEAFFVKQWQRSTKYDWFGVLAFVFKLLKTSENRLFCSEGCISPIVAIKHWTKVTPDHVSPQNFVELIQAAGGYCARKGVT